MIVVHKNYNELFKLDNLLNAWRIFRRGKTLKADVQYFERHLEDNLFDLYEDLQALKYKHRAYKFFQTFDSKKRNIHVAEIRDRIVHRLIYDYLVDIYEPLFISNSYSSRLGKGSHLAVKVFCYFAKLIHAENHGRCFVLKCDIKKYFENVKPDILFRLLKKHIADEKILKIAEEIIYSFPTGIPLGNVTSQIFANIYLNDFDLFIKNVLKVRFYIRYNDDFVILDNNPKRLNIFLGKIREYLAKNCGLEIPEHKASIRKLSWGVDFLGYTILPRAVLLRNKTKDKMFFRAKKENFVSYLGLLKRCHSFNLRQKLKFVIIDKWKVLKP